MKRSEALRRKARAQEPLRTYLVVCEGSVTEKHYLNDLRAHERCSIRLVFHTGAVPKTLVDRAVDEIRRSPDAYDEVWVVFDVDEHPNIEAAKDRAYAKNFNVIISNPWFELWALLHFRYHSSPIHRKDLHKLCVTQMPGYEKLLPSSTLHPLYNTALSNARKLAQWHATRGTTGANPSTNIYELTESIRSHWR